MAKEPDQRPESSDAVRSLLLPWAGEVRAIGVAAPHTDREVVAEIDTRNFDPALWDAIPVAELLEPMLEAIPVPPRRPHREIEDNEEKTEAPSNDPRQVLLFALAGCGIVGALAALAVLLALLRRL